jgi:hypothetical protein
MLACLRCKQPVDEKGHIYIWVGSFIKHTTGICSICTERMDRLLKAVLGG